MLICVIGGGASGMMAALVAAQNENHQVVVFERQSRVGRKLLATGNGRCNLTNMQKRDYHGQDGAFAQSAIGQFDAEKTVQWFAKQGLLTICEESGRVYPYSDQANSVVDVLRFSMERKNITLELGCEIRRIRKNDNGFLVEWDNRSLQCDRLIVACGGLAGTKLGGTMSGYQLLRSMGHRMTKLRPALVQLKTDWKGISALKGVRANCKISIYCDDQLHAQSVGEIQFTDYGISGPVVFEVSRDACQEKGCWVCRLDFVPNITLEELQNMICRDGEQMLTGILHNRLAAMLAKAGGYDRDAVCRSVKCFEIPLVEPLGMDHAQVTAGGIITEDFDPDTMESKLVPGLYACGEVLDIDGDCGGYNLQWAWSSGYCAGLNAGRG